VIEGTDEAPIKKNWITNSSSITLNENDYPLKETKIKCVVIYGEVNLIAETKITNKNEYNYDIIIKSSNGNEFNFDVNSGTLTCTIKEND
jgi:Asp-tRNA(Asn)/Glu-tRNA(Gln) amidotransferase B subunit